MIISIYPAIFIGSIFASLFVRRYLSYIINFINNTGISKLSDYELLDYINYNNVLDILDKDDSDKIIIADNTGSLTISDFDSTKDKIFFETSLTNASVIGNKITVNNSEGDYIITLSGNNSIDLNSPHSVTIPGALDAWNAMHYEHGKLDFQQLFINAINMFDGINLQTGSFVLLSLICQTSG